MFIKIIKPKQTIRKSQAMLVAILMVTAAALAISTAVISVGSARVTMMKTSKQSAIAYSLAEACMENMLMRMARADLSVPPNLNTDDGSCIIEKSGASPYLVTAKATVDKVHREIRATVSVGSDEVLTVTTWEESY